MLNYITYVAVNYYLWEALYNSDPTAVRAGWTLPEMETYVCVNWIARAAYFSNSDNILAARISKGEISTDLMRPTSLFLQFYASALERGRFSRRVRMAAPGARAGDVDF